MILVKIMKQEMVIEMRSFVAVMCILHIAIVIHKKKSHLTGKKLLEKIK